MTTLCIDRDLVLMPSQANWLGACADQALHDELALYPKPGLVSFVDSGSHRDMDSSTFLVSMDALRPYFVQMVQLGAVGADFDDLKVAGMAAEVRMLRATAGVNTHRGAIFSLGLLCASAGVLLREGQALTPCTLRRALRDRWGEALRVRVTGQSGSHGAKAASKWALRGANEEAAQGMPVLFEHVLPAWQSAVKSGASARSSALQAFFAAMGYLDDTNLVHRGGLAALRVSQRVARRLLADMRAGERHAIERAESLHGHFVARRWSPGGAADVFACAAWVMTVTGQR
jgi:triphosphoribosyl-dephospho-CoA synthase